MSRKTLLFLLVCPLLFFLVSEHATADEAEPSVIESTPRYSVGIGQALGYNILQAGFNRFVLDTTFSYISVDSVIENITSPWVWDSDTFFINHIGHPYQGSVYYSAARSNNMNFYESAAVTFMGSLMWEYFMENERQSINDLIVTTTGGVALGEMLFRISDSMWHENNSKGNRFLSFLLSPFTCINKNLFPETKPSEKPREIQSRMRTGASLMLATITYDSTSIETLTDLPGMDDFNFSVNSSINVIYGNPFSENKVKPYDFFTFDLTGGLLNDELLLEFFSEGLITGTNLYFGKDNTERMFGLFLGLDFLYATQAINLGANSIGLGYVQKTKFSNDFFCNMSIYLNAVFIGSSDFPLLKYYDALSAPVYERRNYSLGVGENLKFSINLEKKDLGYISMEYMLYGIQIKPETVETGGSEGFDLTGLFRFSIEKKVTDKWGYGASLFMYQKHGFYHSSKNISSFFPGFSFFLSM